MSDTERGCIWQPSEKKPTTNDALLDETEMNIQI